MSAVLDVEEKIEKSQPDESRVYVRKPYLISVKTYDLMIKHGILTTNDKVELWHGEIIEKMPKGTKHTLATNLVTRFFYRHIDEKAVIRVQDPILLDDFSEPEPDIVLAQPPIEKYLSQHPTPEDVLLIIEVSDSTLYFDRNNKGEAYSKAGIGQYLIVNVENGTVEDYRQPGADGYQSKQTYRRGESFSLVAFPDLEIKTEDFLPS